MRCVPRYGGKRVGAPAEHGSRIASEIVQLGQDSIGVGARSDAFGDHRILDRRRFLGKAAMAILAAEHRIRRGCAALSR